MLKAEIAFRSDEGAEDSAGRRGMRDEQYLVAPAVFLERARKNPAAKGQVVDRQLHWLRVVTYHPDKRVSQLMHYSREIVIEPRSENELYENVPAEGDESELLVARVHRKDGTIVQPEEMSSGGRKPYVRWPELKTGDVVEIAARSWTAGPVGRRGDAPFYFIDYVGSTDTHPILYNEVIVDSPEASPLAIDVLNGKADRVVSEPKDGRKITRYVWDNPPSIPDEPLAPKLSESLPRRRRLHLRELGRFFASGTAAPSAASPSPTIRCAASPRSSPLARRRATRSSRCSSSSSPTTSATSTSSPASGGSRTARKSSSRAVRATATTRPCC